MAIYRGKRVLDIVVSILALALFAPVNFLITLFILLDDGLPLIYRQNRVGKSYREISIIKFRTMRNERVTRVGKWLRQTGLDEVLQFYSVLGGEMSVVGPRPLTQNDVLRMGWNLERYSNRWTIKPGITGLAQLFGGRGKKVSAFFDNYYRHQNSWMLDLKIIMLSFLVNIFGKKRIRVFIGRC
ncbi:MAG: sugar transferase [Gammaproteobacteria bacterium]|nr:sugar transferase [Gammaproteobacteria bacterium]